MFIFVSSFCGSGASNLTSPTMGINVVLSSIMMVIPLRWLQMMARLKVHGPLLRSGLSAADRADNNVTDTVILLAPLNVI